MKGSSSSALALNVRNSDRAITIKASGGTDATGPTSARQVQVCFSSLPLKECLTPPVSRALLVYAEHTHIREQTHSLPSRAYSLEQKVH